MPEGNPKATANNRRNETEKRKTKPAGDTPADAAEQAAGSIATSSGKTVASTGLASAAIGAHAAGDPTTKAGKKRPDPKGKRVPGTG